MRAVSICTIAVLGLLDAGCVDTRPIHYYTIEMPRAPVTPAAPAGPALMVGNISVPPELQDGRIRYRVGSNEVGAYQYHRWIERPGTMISESLVQELRGSGKYRSVMESSSTAAGDYQLRGKLYEFDEIDSETIQTRISLRVDLVDMKSRQVVWGISCSTRSPSAARTSRKW
jgi:cholesterol transport system auxiliary component